VQEIRPTDGQSEEPSKPTGARERRVDGRAGAPEGRDAVAVPGATTQSAAGVLQTEGAPSGVLSHWTVWLVLAISLIASSGGWLISRQHEDLAAQQRFEKEVDRIAMALRERMLVYEGVLYGAVGLYAASYSVERTEWRNYVDHVSIRERLPGIDSVGFVARVPRENLGEFLAVTSEDGAPDFQLKNPGTNPVAMVVKYLEPELAHRSELGLDMSSDPERCAAAETAQNTGLAALSGPVELADGNGVSRAGVVMLLPVYRRGAPTDTPEERESNIQGWVYARFIIEELVRAVLTNQFPGLAVDLFDITATGRGTLLFSSRPSPGPGPGAGAGRSEAPGDGAADLRLRLANRRWLLRVETTPVFGAFATRTGSTLVGAGGSIISLLLFAIAWSLSRTRERALAMAVRMTAALREANERLEHERFLLQALMDNVPDRIYFKDTQSRFLRCNRAHLEAFGLKVPAEAIGRSDYDFFTGEHARQAFEDEQRIMSSGQPLTKEERETWPDRPDTWVLSTKIPLRNESGAIVGTFGISRDITGRKRDEEAMRHAKETAEEASRAKSQFLASMSHELRTPLNSVIGFAGVLLKNRSGNLSATELNYVQRIHANGKHLLTLINQILDLSKIEARKVELEVRPVSLDALVRETLAQQEGLVRDRPIELVADLPGRLAPLQTDAEKLRQILINLIGNGLKFTERGSVTVRVTTRPQDGQPLRLEVADTGIGIAPEKAATVFEAFEQVEVGMDRRYGGTGLGLTISRALCELLGYRLELRSEPGKGSTFSVVLDAAADGAARQEGAATPPGGGGFHGHGTHLGGKDHAQPSDA